MSSTVCWSHLGSSCPPLTGRDCTFWHLLVSEDSQGYERRGPSGTPQLGKEAGEMLHQPPLPVFSPERALGLTKRPVSSLASVEEPPSPTVCVPDSAGLLHPTALSAHSSWPCIRAFIASHHDDHLISVVIKLAINKRADDCYIDQLWVLFFYLCYLSCGREGRRVG